MWQVHTRNWPVTCCYSMLRYVSSAVVERLSGLSYRMTCCSVVCRYRTPQDVQRRRAVPDTLSTRAAQQSAGLHTAQQHTRHSTVHSTCTRWTWQHSTRLRSRLCCGRWSRARSARCRSGLGHPTGRHPTGRLQTGRLCGRAIGYGLYSPTNTRIGAGIAVTSPESDSEPLSRLRRVVVRVFAV